MRESRKRRRRRSGRRRRRGRIREIGEEEGEREHRQTHDIFSIGTVKRTQHVDTIDATSNA